MEKIDVIEMWRGEPIADKEQARYFIAWNMFALGDGGHWHPEDDPHDAKVGTTDEPFWTTEQADVLIARTNECFALLGDYGLFEVVEMLRNVVLGDAE